MTRNAIDALRNQETVRHNLVTEQQDRIWRPVEAVAGAVGNVGSLLRGIGGFKSAFSKRFTKGTSKFGSSHKSRGPWIRTYDKDGNIVVKGGK